MKKESFKKVIKSIEKADSSSKNRSKKQIENIITTQEASPAISSVYITEQQLMEVEIETWNKINARFENQNNKMELRTQYQGWLVSPVLWKRSLAAYGHALLAHLVFAGIIVLIVMLFGI